MAQRITRDLKKEAFWRERLAQQAASGRTIAAWCRQNDVAGSLFHFWKRTIARRDADRPGPQPKTSTRPQEPAVFARVVLAPALPPVHPESLPASGAIEIMLAVGHVVRVPSGFDATTLARVLEVLEGRQC
jgi:transposase-like protein